MRRHSQNITEVTGTQPTGGASGRSGQNEPPTSRSSLRLSLSGEATAFEQQASSAVLDLMGDEGERLGQHKTLMRW